jgi:hypothetical protein
MEIYLMAGSYANPTIITYSIPVSETTAATRAIRGPVGKSGRVLDIIVDASVNFAATTTPAGVVVETLASAGTQIVYAAVDTGVAGAPLTTITSIAASANNVSPPSRTVTANGSNQGILLVHELPADTPIRVSTIAGTGGTPAGVGEAHITIGWY